MSEASPPGGRRARAGTRGVSGYTRSSCRGGLESCLFDCEKEKGTVVWRVSLFERVDYAPGRCSGLCCLEKSLVLSVLFLARPGDFGLAQVSRSGQRNPGVSLSVKLCSRGFESHCEFPPLLSSWRLQRERRGPGSHRLCSVRPGIRGHANNPDRSSSREQGGHRTLALPVRSVGLLGPRGFGGGSRKPHEYSGTRNVAF